MSNRPVVAVLFGGRSSEHSVSCVTAAGVMSEIDASLFRILPIGITPHGTWRVVEDWQTFRFDPANMPEVEDNGTQVFISPDGQLVERNPQGQVRDLDTVDVFFPLLHGAFGEDGTVQGLLTLMDKPFVGPGVFASAASMDKHYTKMVLTAAGIPTAQWCTIYEHTYRANPQATLSDLETLGLPVFVKPARSGSSVGITKVRGRAGLPQALEEAFQHDTKVIVEPHVAGREVECAVLGSVFDPQVRASAPGEITVSGNHEFYDFEAKYLDPQAATLTCPADISAEVAARVRDIARQTFVAFECTGLTRVDTFVLPGGEVLVNELNTSPGFTPSSGYPFMWAKSGLPYGELLTELIRIALSDHATKTRQTGPAS